MEYQSMPVLSVRFKIPEPRKNYVLRKKLMDKLITIDNKKVTIIKAGAGSGKTTLVSSFINENAVENVRWVTMAENMNQAFIFWSYILEGTKDFLGKSFSDFQKLFNGNVQKDNLMQILSLYMNKIMQEKNITLILDDFQYITEGFLLSTIDFFIKNMADNFHLVLLTRAIPDIYLGTVSMEDKVLIIDENEFRMDEDESREFLTHTLGINAQEDKVKEMIINSNGWVGGLQLMAIASKEQPDRIISALSTSNRLIRDYITNEIYIYLSDEERDFLEKTSILGYFSEKICEKYIPQYDFNEIMESILGKNLLVVSIDEDNKVYRYHSIMKDYLNSLFLNDMKEKEKLHNIAADVYYGLGDFEESICQLFEIKAYEKLMNQLLKMPQTSLIFSYMMKVPIEEISKNRDFAYQYFFCHYASMDLSICEEIYNYILKSFKDDDTFYAFKHADLFFNVNWEFKKIKIISLEQIEAMPLNEITKAYLLIKEAYFAFLADRCEEAIGYLDKAHEIYNKTGNEYIEAFILAEKTQILENNGELNEAVLIYKNMYKYVKNMQTMRPAYYIGIAGVYIRQMEIEKAEKALEKAKESMEADALNLNSAYLYTSAELYYVMGEYEKTERIISELAQGEIYKSIFFMGRLLRYPIYRGKNKTLTEKFINDYKMADEILKNSDTDLLYAGILYENKEEDKAFRLIDGLIAKCRKKQNKLKIVEGDLLKARFMSGINSKAKEVVNIFIEAVSYAYKDTIALPFWYEKDTVKFILKKYNNEISTNLSDAELHFIYKAIGEDKNGDLKVITERIYDLTERELEVINQMRNGYTNKVIAENLCISLATVKTHIINIYGKLGVNNRVSAINKIKKVM